MLLKYLGKILFPDQHLKMSSFLLILPDIHATLILKTRIGLSFPELFGKNIDPTLSNFLKIRSLIKKNDNLSIW